MGSLFPKELRIPWGIRIAFLALISFFLLMAWHQVIISEAADKMVVYLFCTGYSVGYIAFCVVSVRAGITFDGKYAIDDHSIRATDGRTQITVRMDQPLYMTRMNIMFQVRYGKREYTYLAMSSDPIDGIIREYVGIPAVKEAMKRNVVIVPWDENIQNWIKEKWNKDTVSDYPKVMYFPGHKSSVATE